MELILSLLQQTCVYLVIAYMLSKTPLILPLLSISSRLSHKISCYVLFSLFCIMGTYFGLQINDAIANTRAMGAVMGGLFGGPVVGFAVGFTGGIHRYSLGGFTDSGLCDFHHSRRLDWRPIARLPGEKEQSQPAV